MQSQAHRRDEPAQAHWPLRPGTWIRPGRRLRRAAAPVASRLSSWRVQVFEVSQRRPCDVTVDRAAQNLNSSFAGEPPET